MLASYHCDGILEMIGLKRRRLYGSSSLQTWSLGPVALGFDRQHSEWVMADGSAGTDLLTSWLGSRGTNRVCVCVCV